MKTILTLLFCIISLMACTPISQFNGNNMHNRHLTAPANPPQAKRVDYTAQYHGYTLNDAWHWLRDQDYPDVNDKVVLDYLQSENDYFQHWLRPNEAFTNTLFEEFKGRLDETDSSVPWVENGYQYQWEYPEGADYRTHLRKPVEANGEYEVFLDENVLAKNADFFDLGDYATSSDNRYLAYSVDTQGDERYVIHVVDLSADSALVETIENTSGDVLFALDGSLIYGALEDEKWRIASINRHRLGAVVQKDQKLLVEHDDGFFLEFSETSDREFIVIGSTQGAVSEFYVIAQTDLNGKPQLLASRDHAFSYTVDHAHGYFWILANDQHVNFRLAKVSDQAPEYSNWQTVLAGQESVYIESLQTFQKLMAVRQSVEGLQQLVLYDYEGQHRLINFDESVFTAYFSNNPEFDQPHLRIHYQSMITPPTIYDFELSSGMLVERKVQAIPSGYDKTRYVSERIMVQGRDGVKVPVTLMYLKDTVFKGRHPLHLYGYGAYGSGMDPSFSTMRLSLVDRGLVYAIAHVRGGDEMGYQWYLDGKLTKRANTFNDFIDVAKGLIASGYTGAGNISISGRSAGGELMGAAVIQAPELWSSAVLGVPFVDVLNTMLDADLPLTPPEWKEWGNPLASREDFVLIRSYSPYNNIQSREYPPMMVTGGLHDPRVTYWEPAKWTAAMRHYKTDDNLLVMRMNMGAGHFANSGRFGRLRDYAEEYTFTLLSHGITQ